MPLYTHLIALWLVLCALLAGCTPKVEPTLAGTWGVCYDGKDDENTVVFGVAYEEVFRFTEDGSFLIEGNGAPMSGTFRFVTVNSTTTSASGDIQLIFTAPASVTMHVPYKYLPEVPERNGYVLLATDSDYLPCQPCGLCQLQVVTTRVD